MSDKKEKRKKNPIKSDLQEKFPTIFFFEIVYNPIENRCNIYNLLHYNRIGVRVSPTWIGQLKWLICSSKTGPPLHILLIQK
jgi:hypothetical protein